MRTELRTRLVWVTVFRMVAACLMFAVLAARVLSRNGAPDLSTRDSLAFATEGAVFLLTVVYGVWLQSKRAERQLAWLQVTCDLLIASGVVLLTGGAESPFTFLYLLAIVSGAILLAHWGAIAAAVGSAALYGAVTGLVQLEVVSPELGIKLLDRRALVLALVSNLLSQGLIAVLATYLARQLIAAGGRVAASEAGLRQLASLQRQILASMPSGLLTCSLEGEVQFINRAGRQILGVADTGDLPAAIAEMIEQARRLRPSDRRSEIQVETAGGTRVLGLGVSALGAEGNQPDSLLVVFQDLTELRRAETALRRADQLASLGKLAAQLAHEIRNPLASMRGSAQMLAQELPRDSTSVKLANILMRESDRLESLVESFLKFARPPPPSFANVRLDSLMAETADLLSQDPIAAGVRIGRDLPPVEASVDEGQIRQVLVNLIRNAFEAAGTGGTVKLSVERTEAHAAIHVWDSAGKIGANDMRRIFEPFFTTRQGGTGLGLSTAQAIVNAHGGWIDVSSSVQAGTTFTVRLPLQRAGEVSGS